VVWVGGGALKEVASKRIACSLYRWFNCKKGQWSSDVGGVPSLDENRKGRGLRGGGRYAWSSSGWKRGDQRPPRASGKEGTWNEQNERGRSLRSEAMGPLQKMSLREEGGNWIDTAARERLGEMHLRGRPNPYILNVNEKNFGKRKEAGSIIRKKGGTASPLPLEGGNDQKGR